VPVYSPIARKYSDFLFIVAITAVVLASAASATDVVTADYPITNHPGDFLVRAAYTDLNMQYAGMFITSVDSTVNLSSYSIVSDGVAEFTVCWSPTYPDGLPSGIYHFHAEPYAYSNTDTFADFYFAVLGSPPTLTYAIATGSFVQLNGVDLIGGSSVTISGAFQSAIGVDNSNGFGSAIDTSSFRYAFDGGDYQALSEGSSFDGTQFTIVGLTGLSETQHHLDLRVTDIAGNVGTGGYDFIYDVTAPTLSMPSGTITITDPNVNITVNISDANGIDWSHTSAGATGGVYAWVDGTESQAHIFASTGLNDGDQFYFWVTATDLAANQTSITVWVTYAPPRPILTAVAPQDNTWVNTNPPASQIYADFTVPQGTLAGGTITINGASVETEVVGSRLYARNFNLAADGEYNMTVVGTSSLGFSSISFNWMFKLDTMAPFVLPHSTNVYHITPTEDGTVRANSENLRAAVALAFSDDSGLGFESGVDPSTISVWIDDTQLTAEEFDATGFIFTPDSDWTYGSHTVFVEMGDVAGNWFFDVLYFGVSSGNPPYLVLNGPSDMSIDQNGTFVDPGATAYDECDLDINSRIVVTGAVDPTTLGDYTLTYDVTNYWDESAASVTRIVHVIPPEIIISPPHNMTAEAAAPTGGVFVTYSISPSPAIGSISITVTLTDLRGTTAQQVNVSSANQSQFTFSPSNNSELPLGDSIITIAATDNAGHATNAQFTVSVVDTTPPVIENDYHDVILTSTDPSGMFYDIGAAIAQDLVSSPENIKYKYYYYGRGGQAVGVPGWFYAGDEDNLVGVRATDEAGNATGAYFQVTVVTPPIWMDLTSEMHWSKFDHADASHAFISDYLDFAGAVIVKPSSANVTFSASGFPAGLSMDGDGDIWWDGTAIEAGTQCNVIVTATVTAVNNQPLDHPLSADKVVTLVFEDWDHPSMPVPMTPEVDVSVQGPTTIAVNDQDRNRNGIPDYNEGTDECISTPVSQVSFTPLTVTVNCSDPANTKVMLVYNSPQHGGYVPSVFNINCKSLYDPILDFLPGITPAPGYPGAINIWTKDGSESRKAAPLQFGGDLVTPGVLYDLDDINGKQLYIEGIWGGTVTIGAYAITRNWAEWDWMADDAYVASSGSADVDVFGGHITTGTPDEGKAPGVIAQLDDTPDTPSDKTAVGVMLFFDPDQMTGATAHLEQSGTGKVHVFAMKLNLDFTDTVDLLPANSTSGGDISSNLSSNNPYHYFWFDGTQAGSVELALVVEKDGVQHRTQIEISIIKIDMSDGVDYDALVKIRGTKLPDGSWFAAAPMLDATHPANLLVRFLNQDGTDNDAIVQKLRNGTYKLIDNGEPCVSLDKWKENDEFLLLCLIMGASADDVYSWYLAILGFTEAEAEKRWQTDDFIIPQTRTLTLQMEGGLSGSIVVTVGKLEWIDNAPIPNRVDLAKDATDHATGAAGTTYRLRVSPMFDYLKDKVVSVNVAGVSSSAFKIGASGIVQYGGADAQFSFVGPIGPDDAYSKGITPGSPTVVRAGGNSVIANVEGLPTGVLMDARIETMIPFIAPPYADGATSDPAFYSAVVVRDNNLCVIGKEGPGYEAAAQRYAFFNVLTGNDGDPNYDLDSAQIAVRFDGSPAVTNAARGPNPNSPPGTVIPPGNYPMGASWANDTTYGGAEPNRAGKKDFTIQSGATTVNVVLLFTDVVYGQWYLDAPAVIGSWTGEKKDGRWSFVGNTPLANDLIGVVTPGDATKPTKVQCEALLAAVQAHLLAHVGVTLVPRGPAVYTYHSTPGPANNGNNKPTNTGFDLPKQ